MLFTSPVSAMADLCILLLHRVEYIGVTHTVLYVYCICGIHPQSLEITKM